jgi:hypothetical protein
MTIDDDSITKLANPYDHGTGKVLTRPKLSPNRKVSSMPSDTRLLIPFKARAFIKGLGGRRDGNRIVAPSHQSGGFSTYLSLAYNSVDILDTMPVL